jgi:hypothetical protein
MLKEQFVVGLQVMIRSDKGFPAITFVERLLAGGVSMFDLR